MRYCCFDVETTGLNTQQDKIIELGYAIYDTKFPAPLLVKSSFIRQDRPLPPEIVEITGIIDPVLSDFGRYAREVFEEFNADLVTRDVNFLVGHNALGFDVPILRANLLALGIVPRELPVLDTKIDLPLQYKPKSTALNYMLADHGRINPFPHRALFDALSCGLLLNHYNVEKIVDVIKYPLIEIRAVVSYDDRALASKLGYYWDAGRKFWLKTVRACFLERETEAASGKFQVVRIK